MCWPDHILRKSNRLLDTENIENKFYPLYDDILNECFPRDQFSICPQYATLMAPARIGDIDSDFTISYVIEALDIDSVVFILEIRPPTHLQVLGVRKYADHQIRRRFGEVSHLVKVPKLYAVSAFGKRLSYSNTYTPATGAIDPASIVDSTSVVRDTAPIERWDSNIMEEEGRLKFLQVAQEIQTMVGVRVRLGA